MLDLDDYGNAAEEMCSLLDRCYEKSETVNCLDRTEKHLDDATSDVRTAWLASFTSFACLESCSAGRHCLNIAPLCIPQGACVRRQECCGFLDGNAACIEGKCCQTRGSSCDDPKDCCPGEGPCRDGVCGGIPCLVAGDECTTDNRCCTKICKPDDPGDPAARGHCAETICEDDKAACAAALDCCSHFCDPASSLCATPKKCGVEGAVCAANTDCCDGTSCLVVPGTLAGACTTLTCALVDVSCNDDDQCCSGRCDPLSSFCVSACVHEGTTCVQKADCCAGDCVGGVCVGTCSTTFCTDSAECCSKSCLDGMCAAACNPKSIHSPCAAGGPLATTVDLMSCVNLVCDADAYCCCGAWDDLCVSAAVALQSTCTDLCK